jgi:hypothetical protein
MADFADRDGFIVRVVNQRTGKAAGIGFVVAERHLITCAHVVNTALGRDQLAQDKPAQDQRLQVDFPLLSGDAPVRSCRVGAWLPPPTSGVSGGDVAGLLMGEALPAGAGRARLLVGPLEWNTAVSVFGYPTGASQPIGAWVRHHLRGNVGGGIMQLDTDTESALHAQPGYSGSPVVIGRPDRGDDAVAGMLASTPRRDDRRDAYAIPVAVFAAAWPDVLAERTLPGGGSMRAGDGGSAPAPSEPAQSEPDPPAPTRRYRDFKNTFKPQPQIQPQIQLPSMPPVGQPPVSQPLVPAAAVQAPSLAQVIAGNWVITIQAPQFTMTLVLMLAVYPIGQQLFEGYFAGTAETVRGSWAIMDNQVRLRGMRMINGPFPQQGLYDTTVAFGSWSYPTLIGTSSGGERVIWQRQG